MALPPNPDFIPPDAQSPVDTVGIARQARTRGIFGGYGQRARTPPFLLLSVGPGNPIPIIYGNIRTSAQVLEASVYGLVLEGYQRIRYLCALGYGELGSIGNIAHNAAVKDQLTKDDNVTGIDVDGNSFASFEALKLSLRHGSLDQDYLPNGQGTLATVLHDHDFNGVDPYEFTTTNEVDFLAFNITFPNGTYDNNPGFRLPIGLRFQYRFRETSGPGAWSDWIGFRFEGMHDGAYTVTTQGREPNSSQIGNPLFARAQYDIEVRYLGTDPPIIHVGSPDPAPILASVTEYGGAPRAYPKIALLEFLDVVTQETNGETVKDVQVDVQGIRIRTWDGSFTVETSANPAWVALDILTNTVYGLGSYFSDSDIDLPGFRDWAAYCDEVVDSAPRHAFNHVFSGDGTAWDAFLGICRMSFVTPKFVDNQLTVVIDRDREPDLLVTQALIKKDSLRLNWRERDEQYDSVTVTFLDESNLFEGDEEVARKAQPFEGAAYRNLTVSPVGITNRRQASRFATRKLLEALYINLKVQFEMVLDGLSLTPGDVFYLSHDTPGYGFSGLVVDAWEDSSDNFYLVLDRDLVVVGTETLLLSNVADSAVTEHAVLSSSGSYPKGTPILFEDFSTNVPSKGCQYAYGDEPAKPFIVEAIELTEELTVSVQAKEYNADIYDDDTDVQTISYTRLPKSGVIPNDVLSLTANNVTQRREDGSTFNTLALSWVYEKMNFSDGAPAPAFVEVHYRVRGFSFWQLAGSVAFPGTYFLVRDQLAPGTIYEFAVTPVSIRGNKKTPSSVGALTIQFTGNPTRPDPPTSPALSALESGGVAVSYSLSWTRAVDETYTDYYEVRYGNGWLASKLLGRVLGNSLTINVKDLAFSHETFGDFVIPSRFYIRARNFSGAYSTTAAVLDQDPVNFGTPFFEREESSEGFDETHGAGGELTNFRRRAIDGNVIIENNGDLAMFSPGMLDTGDTMLKDLHVSFLARVCDEDKTWEYDATWADGNLTWEGLLEDAPRLDIKLWMRKGSNASLFTKVPWEERQAYLQTTDRYFTYMVQVITPDYNQYRVQIYDVYAVAHR